MQAQSINDIQDAIVAEFKSIDDPLFQYEYLLEYSGALNRLDDEMKRDEDLVEGCQSRVWLRLRVEDETFFMDADSDTLIVCGVLALIERVVNGQPVGEVAKADLYFLNDSDLMFTFDDTRRKGIGSVVAAIKEFARQAQ
ncbi:MAG: SufE family protein [Eggerthellaceae bacterium]|nr:SufE family protein [Eggerthellaceae bacterium]